MLRKLRYSFGIVAVGAAVLFFGAALQPARALNPDIQQQVEIAARGDNIQAIVDSMLGLLRTYSQERGEIVEAFAELADEIGASLGMDPSKVALAFAIALADNFTTGETSNYLDIVLAAVPGAFEKDDLVPAGGRMSAKYFYMREWHRENQGNPNWRHGDFFYTFNSTSEHSGGRTLSNDNEVN